MSLAGSTNNLFYPRNWYQARITSVRYSTAQRAKNTDRAEAQCTFPKPMNHENPF